jgi:hypothetical protein
MPARRGRVRAATRKVRSMHRESEKHGPVRDDSLRKDADRPARGGATRTAEDAAGGRGSPSEPERARCMSPADVARRAELTRHLPPSEFPGDRERLLAHVRAHRAPDSVVDAVSRLPEGKEFQTLGEVVRTLGSHPDH